MTIKSLEVDLVGIGAWATRYDGWPALAHALTGHTVATAHLPPTPRPLPGLLPAAERRRLPDGVAAALTVADEAVATAVEHGIDPSTLASVFTSAHGDLSIVDYLCRTLATTPAELSPTRFHLSVHNAAAGHWSIAMRDRAAATALAGGDDSFALGLLEAAVQCIADATPVLLVAFDTPAAGLLSTAVANTELFALAIVIRPVDLQQESLRRLVVGVEPGGSRSFPLPRNAALHALARSSPAAGALALAESIATGSTAAIRYPVGRGTSLRVEVSRDVALIGRVRAG